jgi:16S rRNA (guanine1516-N2)-methyltransferase
MAGNEGPLKNTIAVWTADEKLQGIAHAIAETLQLPLASISPSLPQLQQSQFQFALAVTPNAISDYQLELHDLTQNNSKLLIDYSSGEIAYRAQHGGGRKQAMAKAVGFKSGNLPTVIDATAGLGRDAFVLASLGCHVRMIERSPIMACLLDDALRRATLDEHLKPWINHRLQLVIGDAREQIPLLCERLAADVIYIDPMYPPRRKSALVKKQMRFIQTLVGEDLDSAALLAVALQHAKKRAVVKRPSYAASITGEKPTHTIESKNTRYDVYMIR